MNKNKSPREGGKENVTSDSTSYFDAEYLHRLKNWTRQDERRAAFVSRAFRRFRQVFPDVTDEAVANLVLAWTRTGDGQPYNVGSDFLKADDDLCGRWPDSRLKGDQSEGGQ